MLLCVAVIGVNTSLGLLAPVTAWLDDEFVLLDNFWRVAQAQQVGIDYHDPLGFGPAVLGAALWDWFGVHYDLFRVDEAVFALAIAACGVIVAGRTLRNGSLAWGFCLTLAFIVSGPSIEGTLAMWIGMAEFYNRLVIGALSVLFLLAFATESSPERSFRLSDALIAAVLLNIMFLVKISGPILGLGVLAAGSLLPRAMARRATMLALALLVFAALTALELGATGLHIVALWREYASAGLVRVPGSAVRVAYGLAASDTLFVIALLALFMLSRPPQAGRGWWPDCLVLLSYAVLQVGLNLTNATPATFETALPAVIVLADWDSRRPTEPAGVSWRRWHPAGLAAISARDAIPLAIIAYLLFVQVKGCLAAAFTASVVALGWQTPAPVTAGNGLVFRVLPYNDPRTDELVASTSDGIAALASRGLQGQRIATLDDVNPFPLLFQAPSPKGVRTFWGPRSNIPADASPDAVEVVGDACIVMVPTHGDDEVMALLARAKRQVESQFDPVFSDAWWSIYRRKAGGADAGC